MSLKAAWLWNVGLFALLALGLALGPRAMVRSAEDRLIEAEKSAAVPVAVAPAGSGGATAGGTAAGSAPATAGAPGKRAPAVAALSEVEYCTDQLKTVLRRVLTDCGLIGVGRRGCQPGELRQVAQISDADFNALFLPLRVRAGILLFDKGKEDLDEGAKALIDKLWADRRGASYFFVVGRASTDGPTELNRALSHRRVNSVLFHLQERFPDPEGELEKEVGLLWLGEEYAQLGTEFCGWQRSRTGGECDETTLNRSVILSWIDCRL